MILLSVALLGIAVGALASAYVRQVRRSMRQRSRLRWYSQR